ncbi:methylated-DNA--[protein]-cysteine S-methyltransferase [Limnohabitans sp. DCL3]|uniref:methylated-DNA--[protein]-cysteine S-methyltransferase n=1 Tax=Limnohabitans sp. DCL3 TaxID=3374103 RepID=UPI003A8AF1FC
MKTLKAMRVESPLGNITLLASPQGLCGAWFAHQRHEPAESEQALWQHNAQHPLLEQAALQLQAYFAGDLDAFDLPLDLSGGTPFQQSVWQALLTVPSGQSQTYGQLAKRLHKPEAVRAVGAAVGRNPVSIIVPCHRILGADGQLTGYAGGLWRKQALLKLEGHPIALPSSDSLFPE